jgi:hypothetical protein
MTLTDLGKLLLFLVVFHLACFLIGCGLGFYR